MSIISSVAQLESLYGEPAAAATVQEVAYPERHVDPQSLPSAGQILAALSDSKVGGETYDREWPRRAAETTW